MESREEVRARLREVDAGGSMTMTTRPLVDVATADMAQRRRAMEVRRRQAIAELAAQRRATGLSQTDIAARMGTSQSAVARLETGDRSAVRAVSVRHRELDATTGSSEERDAPAVMTDVASSHRVNQPARPSAERRDLQESSASARGR